MNNNLFFLTVFIGLFGLVIFVSAVQIELPNPLCTGGTGSPDCIESFPQLIAKITDYVLALIAGLAVIMFIWAGILFVTSAGNEGRLGSARRALWWAVIGAAIALAGKGLIEVIKAVIGSSS